MRRSSAIFLAWIAVVAFLFQAQDTVSRQVWINNDEVWIKTPKGPRQLTHGGILKRLPGVSPDGKRLIYVVDRRSHDVPRKSGKSEEQDVVEIDVDGNLLRHIIPEGYVPRPFEPLEWIDSRRIGAMACGHENWVYWILDPDTGKTLKVMMGGFDFVWSHDRRWVARRTIGFFSRQTGEPLDEFDRLLLNETAIYPPPQGEDRIAYGTAPLRMWPHGHSFGPLTWSPHDLWVAFTDRQSPEGDFYVVAASPDGVTLRDAIPTDVDLTAKIDWTDDSHLQLLTGGQTFKFVIDRNSPRELTKAR